MPELSPKQKAFVREYAIDSNATQAAIRAGYSEKTAPEQGSRLLRNVKVKAAVAETQKAHAERVGITVDSLTAGLQKIHDAAYEKDQLAVARQTLMDQGKLHGLITDKAEVTKKSYREVLDELRSTIN